MELAVISLDSCIFAYNRSMAILANFLTDDVEKKDISFMVNLLENDDCKDAKLSYSYLRKDEDKVYIYFFYDGYGIEENEKRERFETSKKDLIGILGQWEKVRQKSNHLIFLNKKEDKTYISINEIDG